MHNIIKPLFFSTCLLSVTGLTGCSLLSVYKIDIPQGAPLTQAQAAKVRLGMTQDQVRYVLGSPAVTDTLSPNQWDYVFDFTPGTYGKKQNVPATHKQQKLTVLFDSSGRVTQIIGLETIPEKQRSVSSIKDD